MNLFSLQLHLALLCGKSLSDTKMELRREQTNSSPLPCSCSETLPALLLWDIWQPVNYGSLNLLIPFSPPEWDSTGKAPLWSRAVAAPALTAHDLMIIQSDLCSNPRWRNSRWSFCSTLWSQFVVAGGLKKYGLVPSPDDGESPHPWSGVAVACYTQWLNLTQILSSLTGLLPTCKPGSQDNLQILFQYNTN